MLVPIAKASEVELLREALARQEAAIQQAFFTFVQNVRAPAVMRQVRLLLDRGDVNGALEIADQYIVRLGDIIPQVFDSFGTTATATLSHELAGAAVAVGFDAAFPAAAKLMREQQLDLITNLTAQQRDALRAVLARALDTGKGPAAAARLFRDLIGLNAPQVDAVLNYQGILEKGSRAALDYALRDRRFDSTVEAAAENDTPLTATQIETMVGRYADRLRSARAVTIARTETLRAMSQASQAALEQVLEATGMPEGRVIRTWQATMDDRTRDTHAEMDGQERGLDEPFDSPSGATLMWPGDPSAPPEETINCRCVVTHSFRPPSKEQA